MLFERDVVKMRAGVNIQKTLTFHANITGDNWDVKGERMT